VTKYKDTKKEAIVYNYEQPKDSNHTYQTTDKVRSMGINGSGSNPMYLPKKKHIEGDPNFKSKKELYDWTEIKKRSSDEKFSKQPFKMKESNNEEKRVPAYGDNGNILLFGTQKQDEIKVNLKRKDPNYKSNSVSEGKVVKKSLTMFKESGGNTLKFA